MPAKRPTHKVLIEREDAIAQKVTDAEAARALIEGDIADPRVAQLAIRADRYERWAKYVADLTVPDELRAWAAAMATAYSKDGKPVTECVVWANKVPWLTALMVVIYGEAEYFWPLELGAKEIKRAEDWMIGKRPPNGVPSIFGGKIAHRVSAITEGSK